ncbi:RNA polymerase sigma factor [Enterococcus saccharolyticus]|uniref:RNA polymerase sigma factor n=1 Tax=Enterococcus saccharolyticus TaxID=41997 RepID=UPI0039E03B14
MTELEKIYNDYFGDIYRFLYRLCGNKHLAEDLTSETFFKAIQSIDSFKGESDIKTWLFQIAKNTYFSYTRKNKIFVNIADIQTEANINIEKTILQKESSEQIIQILHHFPETYKEVFYLRVFGELDFQQIGQLFGRTTNWACVTFHRARKKLINEMREQ